MAKGSQTTSTEINPDLLKIYKEVYSGAKDVADMPFQPYDGDLVSGFTPDDLDAFEATRGQFKDSMNYNPRGMLSQYGNDPLNISAYQNPYETDVVNRAISDLDRARQVQIANTQDRAINAGAFGGSRSAILEGDADRGYYDAVGRTVSDLRNRGFDKASDLAMSDRDYRSQIQSGLLSDQYNTLGLLSGIGGMQRSLNQSDLDAMYGQFGRAIDYPGQALNYLISGANLFPSATTRTDNKKTGWGDVLGTGASLLGSAFGGGYFNKDD